MNDNDDSSALQTFQELDKSKQLGLRSWVTQPGHRLDDIISLGLRTGFGNDWLRLGHVKYFTDGGVGARTAWIIVHGVKIPRTGWQQFRSAGYIKEVDIPHFYADKTSCCFVSKSFGDRDRTDEDFTNLRKIITDERVPRNGSSSSSPYFQ